MTSHDGFTMNDLVTYREKHNEANGEDNRDGANDNYSWNCGVEGPTDDERVNRFDVTAAISAIGITIPVCDVTWSTSTSFV